MRRGRRVGSVWPPHARVAGADASLYNDATMVVMMREGTTTVLSMQNTYEGPPEGFAMVVPVPEVLDEEHVRTLPQEKEPPARRRTPCTRPWHGSEEPPAMAIS